MCYLSAEFLMGPHLGNNLINLGMYEEVRTAIGELGLDFEKLVQLEQEPGLGNGGLGRLAACFIDSLATLEIPSVGYGIRYEFGIFHQEIVDGWQQERTDNWLRFGNPWEIVRPEWAVEVKLRGYTEQYRDEHDRLRVRWVPHKEVVGIPYDTPILGYRNNTANTLRLWKSEASESFDFSVFNRGDYAGAVNRKVASENLSKVLYPNDDQVQGKELRLEQQYFFVTCSLQDMFRILRTQNLPVEKFHEKFAIQLNDTHPAIAVAELMRLLIDEHVMPWDDAWSITTRTFAYTNHTLLPEALECWQLDLFRRVLPRHLEIIYEINARFLDTVRIRFLGDEERLARMSLIDEHGERYVRMAHLACVGSHAINGVAAMHSELVKTDLLQRFPRAVAGEVPEQDQWRDAATLDGAGQSAAGKADHRRDRRGLDHRSRRAAAARAAGRRQRLSAASGMRSSSRTSRTSPRWRWSAPASSIDPQSLFDVQVKRIHEYKRQHLNILHVIALYLRLKADAEHAVPAAHLHLRRQGRAGLSHGQADHQADQRGGRRGQSRCGDPRPAEGGVPAELQCQQRPAHLSGGGSFRADLHGRQGSLRHGQHEVHDERRADHRHAGRRQCRDPRPGRARRISSCSGWTPTGSRRCGAAATARMRPARPTAN